MDTNILFLCPLSTRESPCHPHRMTPSSAKQFQSKEPLPNCRNMAWRPTPYTPTQPKPQRGLLLDTDGRNGLGVPAQSSHQLTRVHTSSQRIVGAISQTFGIFRAQPQFDATCQR